MGGIDCSLSFPLGEAPQGILVSWEALFQKSDSQREGPSVYLRFVLPAPQPLPLPGEDSELMPGVCCVCSLWCGSSDSSHREAGDNHSRPTPQGVRPPPLLAHRRKCLCLSESSNCPVLHTCPRSSGEQRCRGWQKPHFLMAQKSCWGSRDRISCPVPSGIQRAPRPSRVDREAHSSSCC